MLREPIMNRLEEELWRLEGTEDQLDLVKLFGELGWKYGKLSTATKARGPCHLLAMQRENWTIDN